MEITEQSSKRGWKRSQWDRLSDLPDSILCHILSFLRTKDSVRTSVLGKRWRFLWSYVQTLVFEDENQEIINRVMLLRKGYSLSTFRIDGDVAYGCSNYQLETWIIYAIVRNLQKLDIYLHGQDALPQSLFTCKTLVDLKLDWCGVIPVNSTVCLPRLKILHLLYVTYEADESLPHLLSGCPVLEELKIELGKDMVYCNVSSLTVKRLMLNFINERCRDGRGAGRLEINTPALEYLQISENFSGHIESGVLTSLAEADISLENKEMLCFPSLLFFDKLCHVKCMKLNLSFRTEIVDSVLPAWTMSFRNLTELELTADFRFLSKFLENADNLEIINFYKSREGRKGRWTAPPKVPTCLLSHLRIIKLFHIGDEKHEFEMIRYLLRNAKVLERMEIWVCRLLSSNEEHNMLKKISLFQRGSATCRVAFV